VEFYAKVAGMVTAVGAFFGSIVALTKWIVTDQRQMLMEVKAQQDNFIERLHAEIERLERGWENERNAHRETRRRLVQIEGRLVELEEANGRTI